MLPQRKFSANNIFLKSEMIFILQHFEKSVLFTSNTILSLRCRKYINTSRSMLNLTGIDTSRLSHNAQNRTNRYLSTESQHRTAQNHEVKSLLPRTEFLYSHVATICSAIAMHLKAYFEALIRSHLAGITYRKGTAEGCQIHIQISIRFYLRRKYTQSCSKCMADRLL